MRAMDIMTTKPVNLTQSMATGGVGALLGALALLLTAGMLPGCTSAPPRPGWGPAPGTPPAMGRYGRGMRMGGPGMMRGPGAMGPVSVQRHRQAMMGGVPAPYGGLSDPLPKTAATLAAGQSLYAANCATCHGTSGAGDGPAAAGLSPAPANLRALAHSPMGRDDYLMWAISAGGTAYGTAMPAFADALSEDARWQIVRYLQTL